MGNIKIKRLIVLSWIIVILGLITFVSRGPHVSNLLKKLILPELSLATGRQVIAQNMYINVFPLFIGAKDLKVFEDGNEILHIQRVKGYIELSGLLKKRLVLRRLVLSGPDIKSDESQVKEIIGNVKDYLKKERKSPIKVKIRAIALDNGRFAFGYRSASFTGSGLFGEAVIDTQGIFAPRTSIPRINFKIKQFYPKIKGWPELKAEAMGSFVFTDDSVDIRSLQLGFYGSRITAKGVYPVIRDPAMKESPEGSFQMDMDILVGSFKRIFGLKKSGEGDVHAKGGIKVVSADLLRSEIDIDIKGDLYIQTLLELLKVKEKVEGRVDFSGNLKGSLNGLAGSAKAHLRDGNLFDVEVKDLRCNISYIDRVLTFKEGKAALYNGRADAEASVAILGPPDYSLDVRFSDADSPALLNLIGWRPEIPLGKVKGKVSSSGNKFNPSGWFEYESVSRGEDVLGRIKKIKGSYSLRDGLLTLTDIAANTRASTLFARGDVDIPASRLSIDASLKTTDISDITIPFLHDLSGHGEFIGSITGRFDDPLILGKARISSVSYGGYYFGDVTAGNISYRKDILEVKDVSAVAEQGNNTTTTMVSGNARFPEARKLFDFKKPLYAFSVSARNADLERSIRFVYTETMKSYPQGRVDADFNITGKWLSPLYQGSMHVKNPQLYGIAADSAAMAFSYDYSDFLIRDAVFKKGSSKLLISEAIMSGNNRLSFKASGTDILSTDFPVKAMPFDVAISFKAEGRGTLDNPEIELNGAVRSQRFNDTDAGEGKIRASLKGSVLLVDAMLFNGIMVFKGRANLKDDMPWSASLDLRPGRYDFLLNKFLRDKPEDLLINMRGHADMSGNRDHFSANAAISQLNVTLYGNSFSNDADIRIEMKDKDVVLPMMKMRSGTTSFNIHGNIGLTRGYDLVIEGSSALSPIKGFSKRIDTIRGDADFVFAVTGDWSNPRVNGGLTVTDAVFGLKDSPIRISSINGYLFIDENRIVIQKLSGKTGGGDIDMSGIAYLQKLRMQRFYVDAVLNNIDFNISKDFSGSFNGNILYKGSLDSQAMSGEVRINRARYKERVEWKSWLLKAKTKERPRSEAGPIDKTALNIRVYGSDNITIDNNIARASLKVDLLLRGTLSNPVVLGRIESQTGTVYFRNNDFRIVSASADFSDPRRINPVMEIAAETSIKGYNIRMNLDGQMDHFNLSLLSDPPLKEMDILGLLTVGRLGKELKGIEGGIGAGEAASFLTGKVQDVMEERARTLTGLDRLEVDPYVSKTTGTVNPRVTVSKRLLGDKFFVTYSSAIGSTENNVIKLEYILGKNISLVGVRDEKGSIGGDVKFRFEFK